MLGLAGAVAAGFGGGAAQASRKPAAPAPAAAEPAHTTIRLEVAPPPSVAEAPAPAPSAPVPTSLLANTPPEELPAVLATTFDAEPVDRTWSASTASEMRDGMRAALTRGAELRGVACKSSICRVDMRLSKDGPAPRAVFDAMCLGPEAKWAKLGVGCFLAPPETSSNGDRDVAIYAFRDGTPP